jgi:ketosteroid isomerase-like protein
MTTATWVHDLFAAIDRQDADAFASHLAEDGSFHFGNAEPVVGRAAVREAVAGFFGSIAGLAHELSDVWTVDGAVIAQGTVTYTRHDGSTLAVPFCDVFEMDGEAIACYRIYIDVSQLYA